MKRMLLNNNINTWKSLVKQGLIVAAGAGITFIGQNISNIDFGSASPFIVATVTIILQYVDKIYKELDK